MKSLFHKYCNLKRFPFFADNDTLRNLIFLLGLLLIFLIGIDFQMEISKERKEVEYMVAVLSEISSNTIIDLSLLFNLNSPLLFNIIHENQIFHNSLSIKSHRTRGPPAESIQLILTTEIINFCCG